MRPPIPLTRKVDIEELRRRERTTKVMLERRRLAAIRYRHEGRSVAEICQELQCTPCSLRTWVKTFNEQGLDGLKPRKRPGKQRWLTDEQIDEVRTWLDEGPSESQGCHFWTAPQLVKAIEKTFGVRYSSDAIYDILKDLGYKRIVPKTHHHKADPKAAEEFKKNFPIWSRR